MGEWLRSRRDHLGQAARVSLTVGPALILINNFDVALRGVCPPHFGLKAALTFAVPFGVSLYSSMTPLSRRGPAGSVKERS